MNNFKYLLYLFHFSIGLGQFFNSPNDLGTSGASFSGNLGTHAIQTNPAFLGIKSDNGLAVIPVDTFSLSYRVRLIELENKNEIKNIETKLKRDGLERKYEIIKENNTYVLSAPGFKDSFSAHNFSRNLPSSISNYQIIADTTKEIIYKQKYVFRIQLFATDIKDSLKSFINRSKPLIKGLKRNVTLRDSMYRFSVGNFDYEQEALIIKDSLITGGLSPDAFIVKEELKSSSLTAPKLSITVPINYSISLTNNIFNAKWFNTYLGADLVEQPDLKVNLLKSFSPDGISGRFTMSTSLLDLTFKNFGLSLINTSLFSSFTFPNSLFNMIFEGLSFEEVVDISQLDYKLYFLNSSSFSYGIPIEHEALPFETYFGLGFRYLKGNFSYLDSFSGKIKTSTDSIAMFYNQKIINPDFFEFKLGNGFGIDLGVFCNIDDKISGQISFIGLGSSLSSNVPVQHLHQEINLSNKDFEDFDPNDEKWVVLDSVSFEDFKVILPAKLNIGLGYIYSNAIHLKCSIQHLMQTEFVGSVNPRFSAGVEFFPKTNTPIWTGFSQGGIEEAFSIGFGFGIHIGAFHYNFGINQLGGIFNEAKGFSIGSETRLVF